MELFTNPDTGDVHKRDEELYSTNCGKKVANLIRTEATTNQLANTIRDSRYTLCPNCKIQHITKYDNK